MKVRVPGGRILLAESDSGLRESLQRELSSQDHSVVLARSEAEAISALASDEFDLVIAGAGGAHRGDATIDGIEVLKATKASSPATEVVVIMARAHVDAAIECLRGGACDLLYKPLDLAELLAAVERALATRRLRTTAQLYGACSDIISGDSERPLLERIAHTAMQVLDADDASILLMDGSDHLRIAFATGVPEDAQAETRLALGERIAGRVALDRTPAVLIGAPSHDPRFEGVPHANRVRSGLVYPIIHKDTVLGILTLNRVDSPRPFRSTDLETVGIIAAQSALAIQNESLAKHLAASERLAAIGQLAASIVHEINNPLTYISSNTTFARETLSGLPEAPGGGRVLGTADFDELEDVLADIDSGAALLRTIVNDMRGLSRSEVDSSERFDVNAAIRSAIRIAGPTVKTAAEVRTDLEGELMVRGSSGRISQVLLNLLVNAAQAIDGMDGGERWIEVRTRREGGEIVIEVEDSGPGIPAHHLSRILQPFYTTKSSSEGSGLGLAICREIVEQHGGRISGHSEEGKGATFTIVLPRAPLEQVEGTPRPRVLLVEDEDAIRRAFVSYFDRLEVVVAADGAGALELISLAAEIDVIVSDISMPRMNGIELFRATRESFPHLAPRFLFMTGMQSDAVEIEWLRGTGVPILRKPIDFGALSEAIDRVVSERR